MYEKNVFYAAMKFQEITPDEIANKIGVTADYVRKLISGKRKNKHYLDKIIELLSPVIQKMKSTGEIVN